MALRKIDLMHKLFGRAEGKKCSDCCHIQTGRYHDRVLRKCEVYGLTHSEASDWRMTFDACGLFNRATDRENIILLVRPDRVKVEKAEQIPGQQNLFGGFNDD